MTRIPGSGTFPGGVGNRQDPTPGSLPGLSRRGSGKVQSKFSQVVSAVISAGVRGPAVGAGGPSGGMIVASAELMRRVRHGRGELLLSVALALENHAVCRRPEHLGASGLSEHEVVVVLDVLISIAVPIDIKFLWRPQLRDPSDEMVLETAVNGRADAIVTFNERDFKGAKENFGIEVLRPKVILERI